MGADIRTFCVRRANGQEVRELVVSWLAAKGFEPCDEPSLFPFDPETERGIVLAETPAWTTVAFSHAFEEGDRLVFELKKLEKPLLEVWVHDSDISSSGFSVPSSTSGCGRNSSDRTAEEIFFRNWRLSGTAQTWNVRVRGW